MLDEVDRELVVLKFDVLPDDVFFYIFFLLYVEHLLVEDLLQLFISVVYAQLFKWIYLKNFETKNIQ